MKAKVSQLEWAMGGLVLGSCVAAEAAHHGDACEQLVASVVVRNDAFEPTAV